MTKISGAGKASPSRSVKAAGKAAKPAAGNFNVGAANAAAANTPPGAATPSAPSETLSALIALQTEGGGKAKTFVAAQRALNLLDRIRDGLLAGRIPVRDLEALAHAAEAKAHELDAGNGALAAVYNDITLRARVELAKLGR